LGTFRKLRHCAVASFPLAGAPLIPRVHSNEVYHTGAAAELAAGWIARLLRAPFDFAHGPEPVEGRLGFGHAQKKPSAEQSAEGVPSFPFG